MITQSGRLIKRLAICVSRQEFHVATTMSSRNFKGVVACIADIFVKTGAAEINSQWLTWNYGLSRDCGKSAGLSELGASCCPRRDLAGLIHRKA